MLRFSVPLDPPFQRLKPHHRFTRTRASFSFRLNRRGSNNAFLCGEGKLKLTGWFNNNIKCKIETHNHHQVQLNDLDQEPPP
ncbi:hypothetical protein K1719_031471 [Acacia pycnantha]|nr:hypothetical protein K1719_031471 [Acacia pycnantha]